MENNPKDIARYLQKMKTSILAGRYQISPRTKNKSLYLNYILTELKCKEVLMNLSVADFSDTVPNDHPQHLEEILYIFGKTIRLVSRFGKGEETVPLYIKFNLLSNSYLVVISFHRQEYPMTYKFK